MAGLVAGAISMGLGEYTSVRTQNEQVAAELAKELHELSVNPDGGGRGTGRRCGWPAACRSGWPGEVAEVLKHHPEEALRVHAQEELGVVPDELPSPWTAAGVVVRLLRGRAP